MECGHPLVQPSKEESDNGQENSTAKARLRLRPSHWKTKKKSHRQMLRTSMAIPSRLSRYKTHAVLKTVTRPEHQGATIVAHETGRDGEPSESPTPSLRTKTIPMARMTTAKTSTLMPL